MKYLLLALTFFLIGCSTPKKINTTPQFSAPAISKVQKPIQSAKVRTETVLKADSAQPMASYREDLNYIWENIKDAEKYSQELDIEVQKQTQILNQVVLEKNRALEAVNYWQGKQEKALRELYFWRVSCFVIVSLIVALMAAKLGLLGAKFIF